MSLPIDFDPDFDAPRAPLRSLWDALPSKTAFMLGFLCALGVAGTLGFVILLVQLF